MYPLPILHDCFCPTSISFAPTHHLLLELSVNQSVLVAGPLDPESQKTDVLVLVEVILEPLHSDPFFSYGQSEQLVFPKVLPSKIEPHL
jgi:hypothetical protein